MTVAGREEVDKDVYERLKEQDNTLRGLKSLPNPDVSDPCAAGGHGNDAGCYLDFGQVWNNIGQFDQAIAFFNRSDSALKTVADPQARLKKQAFLYKSWGWAYAGKRDCEHAIPKFKEAEHIFESSNFSDDDSKKALLSVKDGLVFCKSAN
jgi:tetratricopeptide (TPR) repeat protein